MKNNKGITLLSLVIAFLLVAILTAITVSTSVNAYNQMKFEGAKAELEEVQKLVDEIAADYQTYLKEIRGTDRGRSYQDYFIERYNASFEDKLLKFHQDYADKLLAEHWEIDVMSDATFYFTSNDLAKYFGLRGIESVVIDFSTRTVYSVFGIRDPKDKNIYYYTSADWGVDNKIEEYHEEEYYPFIDAHEVSHQGEIYDVELLIEPRLDTMIKDVYFYKNGKYVKINDYRDISDEYGSMLRVIIEGRGQYQFLIVDELNNYYMTETVLVLE